MDRVQIGKKWLLSFFRRSMRLRKFVLKIIASVVVVYLLTQSIIVTVQTIQNYHHDVLSWSTRKTILCGGNFIGYGRKFFRMRSVIYIPETDSFQLMCRNESLPPAYWFTGGDHGVGKYIKRINHVTIPSTGELKYKNGVVVIVDRCNSHNYYHAMQDWYNLFLISKFFGIKFKTLQIFLIDRSPKFHNDLYWKILFPTLFDVSELNSTAFFDDAIFSPSGPGNPMEYWTMRNLPYVDEFSKSFLSYFDLTSDKSLYCKNLTITLVIRRDYFLHPHADTLQKRNTQRKFKNEDELIWSLQQAYYNHTIRVFVAEDMTLKEQLKTMIQTDILVGMHGCALTNVLFMPKHGALFEIYPKYWNAKNFYSAMAMWRGIKYGYWRNEKAKNEYQDHYTLVPTDVLVNNVEKMRNRIGCRP